MAKEIHNGMDIIDSCDVIARIDELKSTLEAEYEEYTSEDTAHMSWDAWLADQAGDGGGSDAYEYLALQNLADNCSAEDWKYGEALIRDSYFKQYAQDLADDIGAIDRNATWPTCYIDWDAAADALRSDYSCVEFDGVTYWYR